MEYNREFSAYLQPENRVKKVFQKQMSGYTAGHFFWPSYGKILSFSNDPYGEPKEPWENVQRTYEVLSECKLLTWVEPCKWLNASDTCEWQSLLDQGEALWGAKAFLWFKCEGWQGV